MRSETMSVTHKARGVFFLIHGSHRKQHGVSLYANKEQHWEVGVQAWVLGTGRRHGWRGGQRSVYEGPLMPCESLNFVL